MGVQPAGASQRETVRRRRPPAAEAAAQAAPPGSGDLTEELLRSDQWTDEMVQRCRNPGDRCAAGQRRRRHRLVRHRRLPADRRRAAPTGSRVLSNLDYPWQTYEYLTRVSQIPRPERIRSDSASRPDNIWGFPSYALAEARQRADARAAAGRCSIEPMWADYYTPKAGRVFAGLEREANRIG